jgi:THO complex subunit 1
MNPAGRVMKFSEGQKLFLNSLKTAFETNNFKALEKTFDSLSTTDNDNKKLTMDQIFREFLTKDLLPASVTPLQADCERLVEITVLAARRQMCSYATPIVILSDMFDILTLSHCEWLFKSVEQGVSTWREPVFFTACKNNLLRICNDLLRRLSRTQNTVFCGRILLFLAKFFPFSERSGLNVISEFNLDNTTIFSKEEGAESGEGDGSEADQNKIQIDEDEHNLNVDYSLYCKFWQIQDFFRNPLQCYQKIPWKTFIGMSNDILNTFQSFKLDAASGKSSEGGQATEQYFAKYLTNQNLLQLQLSDSNFRRYIMLQFLILFQYLQSSVKFKTESQVLGNDQTKWIEEVTARIYKLLAETPPNGAEFSESVKHILHREEHWNAWKNDGCPSFAKKPEPGEEGEKKKLVGEGGSSRKRKRKLGDLIRRETEVKRVNLGNPGLTTLWNLTPDNLEACRSQERDFLPGLETYFEEAIEQIDPRNQVEDQYKKVNDGSWGWRALRLMSRRSAHFFTHGNNPIAKLPEYLESMLNKMAKEMPGIGVKEENGEIPSDPNDDVGEMGESMEKEEDESEMKGSVRCTPEQLAALSKILADHYSKLAPKLGIEKEDVKKFEEAHEKNDERCLALLAQWSEMEGDGATKDEISYIVAGLKVGVTLDDAFV